MKALHRPSMLWGFWLLGILLLGGATLWQEVNQRLEQRVRRMERLLQGAEALDAQEVRLRTEAGQADLLVAVLKAGEQPEQVSHRLVEQVRQIWTGPDCRMEGYRAEAVEAEDGAYRLPVSLTVLGPWPRLARGLNTLSRQMGWAHLQTLTLRPSTRRAGWLEMVLTLHLLMENES